MTVGHGYADAVNPGGEGSPVEDSLLRGFFFGTRFGLVGRRSSDVLYDGHSLRGTVLGVGDDGSGNLTLDTDAYGEFEPLPEPEEPVMEWAELAVSSPFTAGHGFGFCIFNGLMYLAGGTKASGGKSREVWSSGDGLTWTKIADPAAWTARDRFHLIPFNGKMYLLFGSLASGRSGEIWESVDGATWTLTVDLGSTSPGQVNDYAACVHNGYVYVMGGEKSGFLSNVWRSADLVSWSEVSSGGFSARTNPAAFSKDGVLYVVGGYNGGNSPPEPSDVMRSYDDGQTWETAIDPVPWTPRYDARVVQFRGRIYMMGGQRDGSPAVLGDTWSSADGETWEEVEEVESWSARFLAGVAAYDDAIVLAGGRGSSDNGDNDVHVYREDADSVSEITLPDAVASPYPSAGLWALVRNEDNGDVWYRIDSADPRLGIVYLRGVTEATFLGAVGDVIEIGRIHAKRDMPFMRKNMGSVKPDTVWLDVGGMDGDDDADSLSVLKTQVFSQGLKPTDPLELVGTTQTDETTRGARRKWRLGFDASPAKAPRSSRGRIRLLGQVRNDRIEVRYVGLGGKQWPR